MVEAGWKSYSAVLDALSQRPPTFSHLRRLNLGPAESDELLARDGRDLRAIGEGSHTPATPTPGNLVAAATAGLE